MPAHNRFHTNDTKRVNAMTRLGRLCVRTRLLKDEFVRRSLKRDELTMLRKNVLEYVGFFKNQAGKNTRNKRVGASLS